LRMKKRFRSLVLFCGLIFGGLQIGEVWEESYPRGVDSIPGSFLKATGRGTLNPDPYYRLGLFYQWDIRNIHLERAATCLGEAICRSPLNQEYWLHLAGVLERQGEAGKAGKALERAKGADPRSYRGDWEAGNIYLQMGQEEKARECYSRILVHYPEKSLLVFEVLGKVYGDSEALLENVVPRTSASFSRYLSYLYEKGDISAMKKVWRKGPSFGFQPDRVETIRYVDSLISRGYLAEAREAYAGRLRTEGRAGPQDDNLLINGGFEEKTVLGGGFDWKISAPAGTEVSFSIEHVWEGKSSLKISFGGKENVDFGHVFQYVAWKPNKSYLLQAKVRTRGVTTQSGIRVEVTGLGKPFHASSEVLTGDHEWKDFRVSFRVPEQCEGGVVRFRREKTEKLDRFIAGEVWIDDVRLTERPL